MYKPGKHYRQLKARDLKLVRKAQKLRVLHRLPEVIQAVASFGGRRRKLNSIAHQP